MANKKPAKVRTIAMTPYELFKLQVQGVYGAFRRTSENYLPPSMGGTTGQRKIIEEQTVLSVIDMDGK